VVRLGIGWQRAGGELATRVRDGWRRADSWLAIGWIETFPSHELAGVAGAKLLLPIGPMTYRWEKYPPLESSPWVIQVDFPEWKKIPWEE